ncbi:DUF2017 domain-containing protein [Streptomyces sodiiphilus]|uniref:DUF2017 domain-containing protein n=1 Tax=Streptomyces sodiiphilus TaxID=226217 RepID=A0ABN2PT77_9ACTN
MPGYFEAAHGAGGGAVIALDEVEISILRSLAVQLLELIGPGGSNGADEEDPLAALMADGPSEPPSDPVLARLFPDAYGGPGEAEGPENRELSAEFRRFTEEELRAGKRERLLAMVRGLDAAGRDARGGGAGAGGAVLALKPEESRQWLTALNDLRLAIGTRLGITDEETSDRLLQLPDRDPDKPLVMAYLWLGGLQESLVETLLP